MGETVPLFSYAYLAVALFFTWLVVGVMVTAFQPPGKKLGVVGWFLVLPLIACLIVGHCLWEVAGHLVYREPRDGDTR